MLISTPRLCTAVAFCTLLTVLQLSCAAPKPIEYRDFKSFSVDKLGFSQSTVRMDLVYFNPNKVGLQLKRTDLDIFIDGTYLGHTAQEWQITIPKKQEFSIPIKIDVDMKNLLKNGWNTLTRKEVLVKVTGKVKVGKANVFISYPVNYEGRHSF